LIKQIVSRAERDFAARQGFQPQEYFVYFKAKNRSIAAKDPQLRRQAVLEMGPIKKGAGRMSHSPRYSSRFA
jgi:hypothetical protein